ncbi:hypothetical protein ACLB2K_008023 [Fragaria x ananassa]
MWDCLRSFAASPLLGVFSRRRVGLAGVLVLDLHSLDTRERLTGAALPGMIFGDRVVVSYSRQDQFLRRIPFVVVVFFNHCKPSVFSSLNLKLRKWRMFSYASVGDPLGLLKVTVVQGKRLVIRDFKSSDPYVVVKLGNQMAKTKVINSCLNPVWNEELTFNPTEPIGVLNLWTVQCEVDVARKGVIGRVKLGWLLEPEGS